MILTDQNLAQQESLPAESRDNVEGSSPHLLEWLKDLTVLFLRYAAASVFDDQLDMISIGSHPDDYAAPVCELKGVPNQIEQYLGDPPSITNDVRDALYIFHNLDTRPGHVT